MTTVSPQLDPPTLIFPGVDAGAPTGSAGTANAATAMLHRQRLAALLRGLVDSFSLTGAEFWLLDDATAELRIEADHGDVTPSGPRPLESARADLVALAGNAVVLEDEEMVTEWKVRRPCRAAVCVPVASDETIHGTLWLYNATPRAFSDADTQLMEIAAGRLAVEHERRRLLDAQRTRATPNAKRPEGDATTTPIAVPRPAAATALGEVEIAGWSDEAASPSSLHDWHELPNGWVLAVAGAVVDMPGATHGEAVLAAQAARVALRCHAEELATRLSVEPIEAGELLTRVSRSVWRDTAGGEGLSLAAAVIDPDSCSGSYALAGGGLAMDVRASRASVETTEQPPVGWDACAEGEGYRSHRFELTLRQRLVLSVVDPRLANPMRADALADAYRGLPAETHRRMTAERTLGLICEGEDRPAAAVAIRWS
ncbi:MAG: GAF domain-containing protein [Planctomycetota bacterium]